MAKRVRKTSNSGRKTSSVDTSKATAKQNLKRESNAQRTQRYVARQKRLTDAANHRASAQRTAFRAQAAAQAAHSAANASKERSRAEAQAAYYNALITSNITGRNPIDPDKDGSVINEGGLSDLTKPGNGLIG